MTTAAGVACFALLASLIAPAAFAAERAGSEPNTPTRDELLRELEQKLGAPITEGEHPTGGLHTIIVPVDSIRADGQGAFEVHVVQRSAPGISASDVSVAIHVGQGVSITAASGAGWTCTLAPGTANCSADYPVTDSDHPDAIDVTLDGAPGLRDGSVRATAEVTWSQRADAAYTAAGSPWPEELGDGLRRVELTDSTSEGLATDSPLDIRARYVGPTRHPVDADGEIAVLETFVGGVEGTAVEVTWRQLCLSEREAAKNPSCDGAVAPRAEFVAGRKDARADKWTAASVAIPAVARTTAFRFEVTAVEGGVTATDRVAIIAEPVVSERLDPRLETLHDLQVDGIVPDPVNTEGHTVPVIVAHVSGPGSSKAKAGRTVTFQVTVPGARLASVRWSTDEAHRGLLAAASQTGNRLRLSIPRGFRDANFVIRATATLSDGTSVSTDELVQVERATPDAPAAQVRNGGEYVIPAKPSPRPGSVSAAPSASPNPSPSATNTPSSSPSPTDTPSPSDSSSPSASPDPDWLCTLANAAIKGTETSLSFTGGGTLTVRGGSLDSAPCAAASTLSFTGSTLQLGEHSFNVDGSVSSAGVSFASGSYQPPAEWAALDTLVQGATLFSVPAGTPFGAAHQDDGTWGALTGQVTLPPVQIVDLPAGWTWQPAQLAVSSVSLELRGSASGPANQAVTVDATLGFDGSVNGQIAAQNIGLFSDAQGNTITASGSGTVNWSKTDGTTSVAFTITATVDGDVVVIQNLTLSGLTLTWASGKDLTLAANAVIGGAGNALTLKASGAYTDSADWNLAIAQDGSWTVTGGIAISGLSGSLTRKTGTTVFSLAGSATGWSPSQYLVGTTINASLTNACPEAAASTGDDACEVSTVRLDLKVSGSLVLPVASTGPIPFAATAQIDLQTWVFSITGGVSVPDGSIGPAELNLRNITVSLTSGDGSGTCTLPTQPKLRSTQSLTVGFAAQATVLGVTATFTGTISDELCMVGTFEGAPPSQFPYAQSLRRVVVAYSSTATSFAVGPGQTLQVPAKGVAIAALLTLPPEVQKIGLSGDGFITAAVGTSPFSFDGTISVNVPSGATMFVAHDGSSLAIDGAQLAVHVAAGSLSLSASVLMSYTTIAGPNTVASSTPLKGTVAFQLGASVSIVLSASVDTGRVPSGVVNDAFGTAGLQVRELSLSLKFGTDMSLGFAANVTLPAAWGAQVGILDGSVVILDANISEQSPCLQFQIGRPQGDTGFAVNMANAGTVWARQVGLFIAPTGCTVGGVTLAPGFGMSFDGQIAQKFQLTVNAQVTLPGAGSTGFAIKASLLVGAFDVGAVQFQQTTASIDIDTAAGRYGVSFSGGVTLFRSTAQLSFSFLANGGSVSANANAQVDLVLPGITVQAALTFSVTVVNGTIQTLQFDAQLNFNLLGIVPIKIQASLDYDNGIIKHVHAGIYFSYLVLVVWNGRNGWVTADYTNNGNAWQFTLGWTGQSLQWYYHHWYDWGWHWADDSFNWISLSGLVRAIERGEAPVATTIEDDTTTVPVASLMLPGTNGRKTFRVTAMTYGIRTITTASLDLMPDYDFAPVMRFTGCTGTARSTCGKRLAVTVDFAHQRLIVHPSGRSVHEDVLNPSVQPGDVVLKGKAWVQVGRLVDTARAKYRDDHPTAQQQLLPLDEWSRFFTAYEKALAEREAQAQPAPSSGAPGSDPMGSPA